MLEVRFCITENDREISTKSPQYPKANFIFQCRHTWMNETHNDMLRNMLRRAEGVLKHRKTQNGGTN